MSKKKLNIVLLNPAYSEGEYAKGRKEAKYTAILPPLGILYIAATSREKGFKPKLLDCDLRGYGVEDIKRIISKEKPDIIGIYTCTANYDYVMKISEAIRPYVKYILLGGPQPTVDPKGSLDNPNVDFILAGEGEYSFPELLENLGNKRAYKKILGLGYKDTKGKIVINKERPFIKDLDQVPFPARDLVPILEYNPSPHHYIYQPSTTMFASRGCPYRCKFCFSSKINKRCYRTRSVDNVISEMKYLKKKYGIKEIHFWDDIFGLNKVWMDEFCDKLISQKVNMTWACEYRANLSDPKLLKKMKKAGCFAIFYGFESLDQEELDFIHKDIKVKQIIDTIRNTKKARIIVKANFIVGLPKDTPAKVRRMVKILKKLNPEYVKWNIFCPYPGTKIYDELKKNPELGKMTEVETSKYTNHEAIFVPKGYKNKEELEKMRAWAFKTYYMRPTMFLQKILSIRHWSDIQRYFRGLRLIVERYVT